MDDGFEHIDPAPLFALEGRVPLDDLFAALQSSTVRHTLLYLSRHESADLEELATVCAGYSAAATGEIKTRDDHRRLRVRLVHEVLPRLAELSFVRLSGDGTGVRETSVPDAVSTVLEVDRGAPG